MESSRTRALISHLASAWGHHRLELLSIEAIFVASDGDEARHAALTMLQSERTEASYLQGWWANSTEVVARNDTGDGGDELARSVGRHAG